MACYHPLKGFIVGTTDNGKKDIKVCSYNTDFLFKEYGNSKIEFLSGIEKGFLSGKGTIYDEWIQIPCGQCVGCRLEHSRQWAVRCMCESEYHEHNYFITLTYDEENVPRSTYVDENGEFQESLTLVKKDLQDFNKRLRSDLEYNGKDGFRFFACGEYGSASARPHYHMIAFGLELDDLQLWSNNKGVSLYNSPFLSKKWGKGHVVVGSVTFESCAYVSRYIMKKHKGQSAHIYDDFNIVPEFIVMSRKPGIGKDYFSDNFEDIYSHDKIVLPDGKLSKPPRYFDNLMNEIDEELMADIKLNRTDIAERLNIYKQQITDADYLMQLQFAENNKIDQISKLVRPL